MEAIGIFINKSPGCRQGMILAQKSAAWLLLPGSGAFGLESFWLGSATSELLRESDDGGVTTEVGLGASEPNKARRLAQREYWTSAVRTGRYGQTCGTRRKPRLRRVPIRVRDLSHADGMIRADERRAVRRSRRSRRTRRSMQARRLPLHTMGDVPNHHGAHGADHGGHGSGLGDHCADHGGHGAGTAGRRGDA